MTRCDFASDSDAKSQRSLGERAIARGEVPGTDPGPALETTIAPIYFRLLISGEALDASFLQALAGLVAAGVASPRRRASR